MTVPELSIIVPVFNAQHTLERLFQDICRAVDMPFELIFVEDYSTDNSAHSLHRMAKNDCRVRVIVLARNCGQQEAVLCGMSYARGRFIANMDADLQHPPALINDMLRCLQNDALDIVYATPTDIRRAPARAVGGAVRDLLFYLLYKKSRGVKVSAYRIMTAELAARVLQARGSFNYFSAMVFSQPVSARSIPFPYVPNPEGKSSYTLKKRVRLFLKIFLHYGPFSAVLKKRPVADCPVKELIGFA